MAELVAIFIPDGAVYTEEEIHFNLEFLSKPDTQYESENDSDLGETVLDASLKFDFHRL